MATEERVAVAAGVPELRERLRSLAAAIGRLSPSELSSRRGSRRTGRARHAGGSDGPDPSRASEAEARGTRHGSGPLPLASARGIACNKGTKPTCRPPVSMISRPRSQPHG
jgi:hypothetical protein